MIQFTEDVENFYENITNFTTISIKNDQNITFTNYSYNFLKNEKFIDKIFFLVLSFNDTLNVNHTL